VEERVEEGRGTEFLGESEGWVSFWSVDEEGRGTEFLGESEGWVSFWSVDEEGGESESG